MGVFNNNCMVENGKGEMQDANINVYGVGYDYLEQFQIKVIAGRAFSAAFRSDTTEAMILNEEATRQLGYSDPAQAVGKRFDQFGNKGKIVGVVKDFHFLSLREAVKPLSIRLMPDQCDLLCVKVSGQKLPVVLVTLERMWKRMLPDRPFSYFFLDEYFDRQYRGEDRFGKLFLYFASLAIFISCLGLTGLASYGTLQRTKEIGIRKVIGASAGSITMLLSRDFLTLVGWAFLVAAPLAWFFINKWLEGFAYRVGVQWWIFALAGFSAFFVALCTVCFHTIRAAMANPVKSLRAE
jgi:putative ABC transport system permease protein